MRNSIKMLTANFGPDGILKDFMVNPPIMSMPAKPAPPSNLKVVTPPEKAKSTTSTTGKTPDAPLVAATPPP